MRFLPNKTIFKSLLCYVLSTLLLAESLQAQWIVSQSTPPVIEAPKKAEISPERYPISYDEKTGKLLETTITNNDYTLVLDSDGKQKSLTLSAQMEAYIAEQEAKARKAAEQQERGGRSSRADGRFAPKGAKLISRTELIEGAKKAKSDVKNGVGAQHAAPFRGGKLVIARSEATKQSQLDKSAVRKITEVYDITAADGKVHRIRETRRVDADGNLLSRQLVDNFKLDRKTRARIVTTFDADNHLIRLAEKYSTKIKGGYHIVKFLSTKFDDSGNPLDRRKTADKIVKTGFFNSVFGQILGIALIIGAAFLGAALLGPALAGLGGIFGATIGVGASAVTFGAAVGAAIGTAIGQFAISLAQGASFKQALIGALISAAAVIVTFGIAKFFSGFADTTAIGKLLQSFGNSLAKTLPGNIGTSPTAVARNFFTQFSLRVGTEQFSSTFGRKLGAFGTAALLTVGSFFAGGLVNSALGGGAFSPTLGDIANVGLQAGAQGGIAQAFRNEHGLGAQFASQVASLSAGGLNVEVVSNAFSAVGQSLVGVGKAFTDTLKLFDPTTESGIRSAGIVKSANETGVNIKGYFTDGKEVIGAYGEVLGRGVVLLAPKSTLVQASLLKAHELLSDAFGPKTEPLIQMSGRNSSDYLANSLTETENRFRDSVTMPVERDINDLQLSGKGFQQLMDIDATRTAADTVFMRQVTGSSRIFSGPQILPNIQLSTTEANADYILQGYATGLKTTTLVASLVMPELAAAKYGLQAGRFILDGTTNAIYTALDGGSPLDIGISFFVGGSTSRLGGKIFGEQVGFLRNFVAGGIVNEGTYLGTQAILNRKDVLMNVENPRAITLTGVSFSFLGGSLGRGLTYKMSDTLLKDYASFGISSPFNLVTAYAFDDKQINPNNYSPIQFNFNFPNTSLRYYANQYDNE